MTIPNIIGLQNTAAYIHTGPLSLTFSMKKGRVNLIAIAYVRVPRILVRTTGTQAGSFSEEYNWEPSRGEERKRKIDKIERGRERERYRDKDRDKETCRKRNRETEGKRERWNKRKKERERV